MSGKVACAFSSKIQPADSEVTYALLKPADVFGKELAQGFFADLDAEAFRLLLPFHNSIFDAISGGPDFQIRPDSLKGSERSKTFF